MPRDPEHEAHTGEAIKELDPLFQHRARLGICVLLSNTDALNFSRLKALLGETDGNLGAQLKKLEGHGYVTVRKVFENRKPLSWYSLTGSGQDAVTSHLAALQKIIGAANNGI
jgi:DNA-binding HxlR family transcriptional regulator